MRKIISLLFLIMFVVGTDVFLISPLLPTLQHLFHVPTKIAGWMMGAYALGYAVFALIAGPLSDGLDRKKVMASGMLCFSIATFLCGIATSFWSMFLFRLLAGFSAAFIGPQVWAIVPTLYPGPKTAKALGIVFAGLAAAQVLGVPIGSLLASTHWYYSFFAVGGFSMLLTVLIFLLLPSMKPHHTQGSRSSILQRYMPLIKSPKAKGSYTAYFLFQLGNFSTFSFFGKWITERFEIPVDHVGYIMIFLGLGNLVGSLLSATVIQRYRRYKTMVSSSLAIIPLFILLPHLKWIWTVCVVYFGISVILNIMTPAIAEQLLSLNPSTRGTITSLTNATMYASVTLGSWTAGLLYSFLGGFSTVGIYSAICFAFSLSTFIASGVLKERQDQRHKLAS
jgi:predicted MFS family arabinose efflux permease